MTNITDVQSLDAKWHRKLIVAKFPSRRNQTNPATRVGPMPSDMVRRTDPLKPTQTKRAKKTVDYLARIQCVGTSRSRLKLYWAERLALDGHKGVPDPKDTENWNKFSYSDISAVAAELGYETKISMLPAEVKAKYRCANLAIAGAVVCRFHGGSAGQVLRNARENIYAMLMPAAQRLVKIVVKGKHEPAVVQAIKEVFDIAGLKKPELSSGVGYSEELIAKMAEVFTEPQLEEYIKLSKMLQSAMPEGEANSDGNNNNESDSPRQLADAKVITVSAAKMTELIKTPTRQRKS